jgi:Na+/proline symporter
LEFASHPLEIVFAIMAVIVFCVPVFTWRRATMDQAIVEDVASKIIADHTVAEEGFKLAKCATMVIVAGLTLFLAPPPPTLRTLPQTYALVLGWIVVAIIMIVRSLMSKSVNAKLRRMAQAELSRVEEDTDTIRANDAAEALEMARERILRMRRRITSSDIRATDRLPPPGEDIA